MQERKTPTQGWAKMTLGLTLLFAVGSFAYFALAGQPLSGVMLAILVLVAGYWEYRRKRQDEQIAERYEAEAEEQRQKRQK